MSDQVDFLEKAISEGIQSAVDSFPSAVSSDEVEALKELSTEELQKLKDVRIAIEAGADVAAVNGNGILSF